MWHGPATLELVADLSPAEAAAYPIPGAHSIWELVLHMSVWAEIPRARLEGKSLEPPPPERDWPAPEAPTADHWRAAIDRLIAAYTELSQAVKVLEAADLDRPIGTSEYTAATMLNGVVEHGCYHGGQIALLKRAVRPGGST